MYHIRPSIVHKGFHVLLPRWQDLYMVEEAPVWVVMELVQEALLGEIVGEDIGDGLLPKTDIPAVLRTSKPWHHEVCLPIDLLHPSDFPSCHQPVKQQIGSLVVQVDLIDEVD